MSREEKERAAAAKAHLAEAKRLRKQQKEAVAAERRARLDSQEANRVGRAAALHAQTQRDQYFDGACALTPYLGVDGPDGRFIVDTSDHNISRRLFAEGTYASHALPLVQRLAADFGHPLPAGGAIVDIGANLGMVAIASVMAHGFARAIAAEAHPPNLRLLRANVALNELEDRVQVLGALSDVDGTGTINGTAGASGAGRVRTDYSDPSRIDVPLARLDTLVARGEVVVDDVTLVWIDTQGHEPRVLAGAQCLLELRVPMLVEFSPHHLHGQPDGLERMHDVIRSAFSGMVDVRRGDGARPVLRPTAEIGQLTESLGDRFTDLLLLPR